MSHLLDAVSLGKIVQIRERLLKAQAAGKKVYRFESGDPSFKPAAHVIAAGKQALDEGKTHYIPNDGIPELRKALAKKVNTLNGIPAEASNIYLTNGAMHALYVTFFSLLEAGDEVIVPEPMWTEVVENIRLARGVPVAVKLKPENAYEYSPSAIEKKIGPKTKAIFLNTPHNPTGAILSKETLQAILEIARKHDLWIISDEAYEDVVFAPYTHHSIASMGLDRKEKIISIYSFSKSHAMAGLRTGYIVTFSPLLQDRIPKALRCTINGVNSIAQWAALAATEGSREHIESMKKEYLVRRDLMMEALSGVPGLIPFNPRGTFFVWAEVEPSFLQRLHLPSTDALSNNLAEAGIGSTPGDAFGDTCANALRFAFSCSTEMIREGAPLLRKALLHK